MSRSEATPGSLRVLIVDQHEVSRAAIRALLRTEGLDVVADVSDWGQVLTLGDEISPDLAIVDVGTDPRQAIETARGLARLPSLPTVVLTSSTPADGDVNGYPFISKPDLCARQLRLAMRTLNQQP
jgi:CheY-like chemotaxis protein